LWNSKPEAQGALPPVMLQLSVLLLRRRSTTIIHPSK
jgi:hypothetical protein